MPKIKLQPLLVCPLCGTLQYAESENGCGCNEMLVDPYNVHLNVNIQLTDIDDDNLREWIDENGWANHALELIEDKSGLLWIKNCPYAIEYQKVSLKVLTHASDR